jgi:hypothetical protein
MTFGSSLGTHNATTAASIADHGGENDDVHGGVLTIFCPISAGGLRVPQGTPNSSLAFCNTTLVSGEGSCCCTTPPGAETSGLPAMPLGGDR